MNQFISICLLFFTTVSQAQIFVAKRSESLNSTELRTICKEMSSNHLEDIHQLEVLYSELKLLNAPNENSDILSIIKKADQIHSLIEKIKEISKRIQLVLKPEWNTESIPIKLVWEIPYSIFYDDTEYLNLKSNFKNSISEGQDEALLSQALNSEDVQLPFAKEFKNNFERRKAVRIDPNIFYRYITYNRNLVTDKKINKAFFLNSENSDVKEYLTLNFNPIDRSEYLQDRSFLISYEKDATILEACQFLNTLVFEVDIQYRVFIFGTKNEYMKKINLIYKNEM